MTHYTNRVRRKEKWLTPRVTLRRLPVAVLSRKALRARLPRAANKAILTKKAPNDNSFGAFFAFAILRGLNNLTGVLFCHLLNDSPGKIKNYSLFLNGKTYFF